MDGSTAAAYELFAPFYDAVNGEPDDRVREILDLMNTHAPDAQRIIELGCGTGAVLAGLGSGYTLTGIDFSPSMLDVAKRRVPRGRFFVDDITTFDLGERFDVALCVLDTLNHVTSAEGWASVFARVAKHLEPEGLFIFDVNTIGRMTSLDEMAPWVYDFGEHTLIMSLAFEAPYAHWDIRLFEHLDDDTYRLREARITERTMELDDMLALASSDFDVVATSNTAGGAASDDEPRAVITLRRRSIRQ